jgi:hypothetical protein
LISSLVATRIIFILGFVNLVTGLLIFFSCRCLPGSAIGKSLMKRPRFQKFFKFHCYLWWIFWTSVVIHATLVLVYLGVPF